jgi:HSP20 family protein
MFEDIDQMFMDMEETMREEFRRASERAPKDLIRERLLPSGAKVKEWGPFVYGYCVTIGPEGKPRIREFGNIKLGTRMGRPRVHIQEKREPLVDIMENDGTVNVIAELPGVEKKHIELNTTREILTIKVNTPQRKYYKKIDLPSDVDPREAKSTYKNGVLEVILKKTNEEQTKGEHIPIR